MKGKLKKFLKKGQTAVEYLFLTSVLVVMLMGISKKIQDYLIGTGRCPSPAFICRLMDQYNGPGLFDTDSRFRYFTIRK